MALGKGKPLSFSSGLQFRVVKGQGEKDRIILLDGKELTLGRAFQDQQAGEGEVLFLESSVSRLHASLSWKEDKGCFQLTHRSGTNPTMVNGKSAKKLLLEPGDRVQMGLLILVLEEVRGGRIYGTDDRSEIQRRLRAIIAEVEGEFSHVKFE